MIAKSRARRAVVSYFIDAKAFSADQAITFIPRDNTEAHALERLTDTGDIRRQADGRYYADQERLARRGKRRWMALAGLGAIAAGIALFG
jgi:hypothetical protein